MFLPASKILMHRPIVYAVINVNGKKILCGVALLQAIANLSTAVIRHGGGFVCNAKGLARIVLP
jgi:hypothetical protein